MDFSHIDGLNEEEGIRYCGSKEGWKMILESTLKSLPENLETAVGQVGNSDLTDYCRIVHGLKSTLRAIGASDLSEQAAGLEACGKEGKRDELLVRNQTFVDGCRKMIRQLSDLFSPQGVEQLPPASEKMIGDAYNSIYEFLTFLDYDSINMVLSSMRKYSLPESDRARFDGLEEAYRKLDRSAFETILSEVL